MAERRMRRPPVGVLLFMVTAGVAAVFLVTILREPPIRSPRPGRKPATEPAAAPPATVAEKPARPARRSPPTEAKKKPAKKEPAAPAGKKNVAAVAVRTPALTPQQKKEIARRWRASAALIAESRSPKERQRLERHMRRFVGRGAARGGEGAWVDPQLEALQMHAAVSAEPLPDPEPDASEKRRLEQLEKLRQRKAVGLLDHIHGGLAWLALHQAPDGHFSDAASAARCNELGHRPCVRMRGKKRFADAGTALAIMAFLDFRDQDVLGLFEPSLASAVQWLRKRQRGNGSFPDQRQLYENAIALMALAQAAESTGDEKLREAVGKGLALFAQGSGP
ncbi:MAG: hypothetical protein ACYTF8_09685, partial [Planctomycetota bacterium]